MTQQKIKGWILAPLLLLVNIMKHPVECYKNIIGGSTLYEERYQYLCS